ncbi:MAG: hypothetical protein SPJ70_03425, partial [Candidatus Borkfalkiaceae bacterium]|nr:hypothetical protein [Christensenellaceae bacterium]
YIDPVTNFNTKVEGTENEYLLADFSVSGYKHYITLENAAYSISDNKLVVTSNKGWSGVSVKYTLPEAITGAGEIRIKVAASDQVRLFNVYFADSSSITAATPAKGAVTLAIPIPADKRSLAVTAVEVGAVNATDNETRTVEVDEITYIPYTAETAFNSAVTDVENGKLLADFNANGYYDYLTIEGGTTWGNQPTKTIEGGALTMSLTLTQLNRYVKYAFASAIDKDDILTLSFIAKSSTNYRVYVFDEAGNSAYHNFGASENYVTNANALSGYADYAKLTGKIVAIGFASNYVDCYKDGQATVLTVDRIAYEYCDKITGFNQLVSGSTTEYQLAKFDVNGYKNYLSLAGTQFDWAGQQSSYTLSDGKLNVVSRRNWSNSYIKYTFPTALDKNTVGEVKFNYTVESGKTALFYLFDENGNSVHVNGSSSATEVTIPANSVGSLAGSKVAAIGISSAEANVDNSIVVNITVSQISYEKLDPVTNFNTLVAGTENEYLLADFNVNGYKQYLQNVGSGKYTLVENGLSVTGASWDNNAVKYTLPSSIAVGDIEKIKVEFIVTGGKHGVVRASDGTNYSGTNTDVSPMEFTIDTAKVTGDKIVSFLLSCNDTSTAIVYTKITYVKKTA